MAPRHLFLPDLIWPLDPDTGRYPVVDRVDDPVRWRAWADADTPIVTQWDDGRHAGPAPGRTATSSSSEPSLVAGMLTDLDVRPGQRVLDVGAGTGWTTALLTACAGGRGVVGVELDPEVAGAARARLRAAGVDAPVVTGDGADGWADAAPYDRVQCTYGVLRVPPAWIVQTRPGGVIVAPWRTRFAHRGAVVRLTVGADGTASGRFTRVAEFMQSRPERQEWLEHTDYVPPGGAWPVGTVKSTSTLGPEELGGFAVGILVPGVVHTVNEAANGTITAWLYALRDRSWAAVFFDGDPEAEVYQGGERRLWDEVEAAHRWWIGHGRPGQERFGLTTGPEGETAWLDRPDRPLR
ncbi:MULTISPECIES: methyltransferase domain-containing protein [Thermomonosporaceae]|uniref:methyltransferase domain-containing protein n=1 Tax=Thermomonosporaceae TaxID=2012 RepID=UPI00255A8409|nr:MULTISPECIES: methyltransferase domain-containing protein [Thermomonosporaceae]MDL4775621.1 methyltransferase domain-containing protein [Actinomadura xylanilytica]